MQRHTTCPVSKASVNPSLQQGTWPRVLPIRPAAGVAPDGFAILVQRRRGATGWPPPRCALSTLSVAATAVAQGVRRRLVHIISASMTSVLTPSEFTPFSLAEIVPVNHNTKIYRFKLPDQVSLGLPVASCVLVR